MIVISILCPDKKHSALLTIDVQRDFTLYHHKMT